MVDRLAIVAHELRGPISVVDHSLLLLVGELRQAGGLSPRVQTLLGRLSRNTALANRIIGDLLDTARFDLGAITLRRGVVDLAPMIQEVLGSLRTAERERVSLVLPAPGQAMVSCDPERIAQVLSNLVRNALQHGHGLIEIRLSVAEGACSFVIENGGLIAGDLDQRVFRPFTRGTQKGDGLGLGLYIVRRLIEAHAGTTNFQAADGRVRVTVVLPQETQRETQRKA